MSLPGDGNTSLFDIAFNDAPIGMAIVGLDGSWVRVNPALCALTGYSEQGLLKQGFHDITHPDDVDTDLEQIQDLLSGDRRTYSVEKRYFTATGEPIWVRLHVSLVADPDGRPQHFLVHIVDVTEHKEMEQRLKRLADHDPLTMLWNRSRFDEDLQRQVARCQRYGEHAALLLLDLDNFKRVNDTLGHKAGDDLLRAVADALRGRLRTTDALARLGGDEFAVLLANVTAAQAEVLAEEVAAAIRNRPIEVQGRWISATSSVGVAVLDETIASADAAFMEADQAMYDAKAAGRDRTAVRV